MSSISALALKLSTYVLSFSTFVLFFPVQASMAPDVTQGAELKDEKEPLYNTPSTTLAGMKTFNKGPPPPGPVSPYATTTLLQQTDSSAFRPIQPSYPMLTNDHSGMQHVDMNNPGNYAGEFEVTCSECAGFKLDVVDDQ